ncbi:MAG: hypothetical protein GY679_01325 [Mycoplasma sp.]|nr:hypothetical protein [Mycoplasma sp.]
MKFVIDVSGDKAIQDAIDKKILSIDMAVKKITIDLFSSIIKKTPVDLGTAKNNWQASIGSPKTSIIEGTDKTGGPTIQKMTKEVLKANFLNDDTVYLSNNLPYIEVLEDGSSTWAPEGMIKTSIAEFDGLVKKEDAKLWAIN